jgi:predicted GNAT family N-acyltransferase
MEDNTLAAQQENEMATLTHSIVEWRHLKDKCDDAKQILRENNKKMKALEEVILRVMKQNNIGALDLKSSGGRVLYKKQKRQAGLGQKNMVKLMSEHLQSEEKASELMKYIQEHREVVTKESIAYEKTE